VRLGGGGRFVYSDRVLDAIDEACSSGLRLWGRRRGRRLWLGYLDPFTAPLQELPARPAEGIAVLVMVAALLADDQPDVTSTF
jgi:hypothetical protein